jgi:hypothetical protein
MAPTAEALPLPTIDSQSVLNEKVPVLVDVSAGPEGDITNIPTSTSPVQPTSVSHFELEDHPIDVLRKLRV